jgi:hypothetical protein
VRVWGLVKEEYAPTALSGRGACSPAVAGHHQGTLIVYTSSKPSLCALELLVHVDPSITPSSLQLVWRAFLKMPRLSRSEMKICASEKPGRERAASGGLRTIGVGELQAGLAAAR